MLETSIAAACRSRSGCAATDALGAWAQEGAALAGGQARCHPFMPQRAEDAASTSSPCEQSRQHFVMAPRAIDGIRFQKRVTMDPQQPLCGGNARR